MKDSSKEMKLVEMLKRLNLLDDDLDAAFRFIEERVVRTRMMDAAIDKINQAKILAGEIADDLSYDKIPGDVSELYPSTLDALAVVESSLEKLKQLIERDKRSTEFPRKKESDAY
jgi:hypothetical protein